MDDCDFLLNSDWDPVYLASIFDSEFDECSCLWDNNTTDLELLEGVKLLEMYSPIVEDISLDDEVLCSALEQIETESCVKS